MKARLITFEGIDGVGKTTHIARAMAYLSSMGISLTTYREPGATPLGEELRSILKHGIAEDALAELMLFAAARAELVSTLVLPDLERGVFVILDRFTDSTLAYQGALKKITHTELVACCHAAARGLRPDLTLWLDLEPRDAFHRGYPLAQAFDDMTTDSTLDAIEQRSIGYFNRVRQIYRDLAKAEPHRIVRIEANGSIEETATLVQDVLTARLNEWHKEND